MKYVIVDTTENTGRMYMNAFGENCQLEENAMLFDTEEKANETIKVNGWENWATVIESNIE
jgi:hypothetical protein